MKIPIFVQNGKTSLHVGMANGQCNSPASFGFVHKKFIIVWPMKLHIAEVVNYTLTKSRVSSSILMIFFFFFDCISL